MRSRAVASRRYSAALRRLMERAQAAGVDEDRFQTMFEKSLEQQDLHHHPRATTVTTRRGGRFVAFVRILIYATIPILLLCAVNALLDNRPMNVFASKIQDLIYPGLRLLRKLTIPIISAFPSLTELYDETCLIQNPFFRVSDMDCWPCSSIRQVTEMTDADVPFEPQANPPFVYKTNQKYLHYADLKGAYLENKQLFDDDSPKILVNGADVLLADDFFREFNATESNSYKWRLNRMMPALLMRKLFPRPGIIPRLGQSTERFIMIDNAASQSYVLPEPECNYVFVIQSSGERTIELVPAKECTGKCDAVIITLRSPYMLWYNWWYWRPVSHSTKINATSISYIGSYC